MQLDPLKVLGLTIPTFCILYTFSWSGLPPWSHYRETFGNPDYYLDLYYDTNPEGVFQKAKPATKIGFRGYVAASDGEEAITGYRVQDHGDSVYVFHSRHGRFEGKLAREARSHCESTLRYQIVANGGESATGVLKAAFCP